MGWLFGHHNLLKRLQARAVMRALDIQPSDTVLDFGCGMGYITVEMAKQAKKAYGIDVVDFILDIPIPDQLWSRLEFVRSSGTATPFLDSHFDRVLASEVLPMIPDPSLFLTEIRRILKPGGQLVVSNGAGHPAIRDAFELRTRLFRYLLKRYSDRMPANYEEYCTRLQESFGTARRRFLSVDDVRGFLEKAGFRTEQIGYAPGWLAYSYLSWSQFIMFLRHGRTLAQHYFVPKFLVLSLLDHLDRRRYSRGLIVVATRTTHDC